MKKLLITLLVWMAAIGGLTAQSFTNPIYELADPYLTYYNGYYYATGTTGGNVTIKRAKTLQELKGAAGKTIFSPSSDANAPRYAYWAPEIHRIDGIWYCYFTANNVGDDVYQACHVLQADSDDPYNAHWTYKGRIYDPAADYYFIDATILQLNGQLYMVYCGCEPDHVNHFPQRLYINKMSSPTSLVSGRTLISSPSLSWEGNGVNEGPEVIVHGGKVWLAYSTSGCWTPDYKLGLLELTVGNDPLVASNWYKHPDPVFTGNGGIGVYAPGHHCFFTSPDGTEDWFAYHATPESGGACNASRTVRAQRLYRNADGSPNFGSAIAGGMFLTAPSGEPATPVGNVANGVYQIVCRATGQLLDLASASHLLNTNIQQYTSNGNDAQKWALQCHSDGYYTITAVAGGLSMDVQNASNDNAANIQTYAPNGGDCQKWAFEDLGDGYYKIVSKKSGKVLDINVNTGNLQQYAWLSGENQQFSLTLIGTAPHPTAPFVAYESYNMHANYMRHAYGVGKIDKYVTGIDDAYWKMVPGLSGQGVSFQSKNYPSNYLRQKDGAMVLNGNDGSAEFAQDASFVPVAGLANGKHVSFRWVGDANRYIRHRDGKLYCETVSAGTGYNDATWILMRPWFDHSADIATVYKDSEYRGDAYGLPEGQYTNADLFVRGMPWNAISSLKQPKGFKTTLYTGNNLNGTSASYNENTTYVGDNMNDKTNSIRVEADGVRGLDGTYKIIGRNSGQFWDMDGNGTGNNTHIVQWTDEGDERYQHWQLAEVEKGVYKIHNVGSPDRVAEVKGGSKENRAELQIYDDNGGYHQQFIAYQPEAGWYQFVVRNSGKIVELPDNSLSAGTQLKLWDNNGQTCSHWQIYNDHYTGLDETPDTASASLYPSPAKDWLHIRFATEGPHQVRLLTATGRVIATAFSNDTRLELGVASLAPGLYLADIDGSVYKWTKR